VKAVKYKMMQEPCNVVGTGTEASMENFASYESGLCLGSLMVHIVVRRHSRWECERGCCLLGRAVQVYDAAWGRRSSASRNLMLQRKGLSKVANPYL
jgi:hypothetical protein